MIRPLALAVILALAGCQSADVQQLSLIHI